MRFINYLKDLLIIVMALAFLGHLGCIVRFGSVAIQEPNALWLIGDIALIGIILGLGIYWMVKDLRRKY